MSTSDLTARLRRPITRVNAEVTLLAEAALQAADEIERLHAQIAQMRRDHAREIREIERDAATEERWKAAQGDEYGSY